jgi:hypothetical protein
LSASAAKTVAIVQSSYIPWKGYFDLINSVDEFILYDDRQFTRRDWRNRNRIKTPQGVTWLSIPVKVRGKYTQRIDETEIADNGWAERHWRTLEHAYRAAPQFDLYRADLEDLYRAAGAELMLSRVNRSFLEAICRFLGFGTPLSWSTEYSVSGSKTERLVQLCSAAGATAYLSGPTARTYMDESLFADAGVELSYMDYSGYPEYPQLYPPFEHAVSIVDLLFHTGEHAPGYLKSLGPIPGGGRGAAPYDAVTS